MQRTTLLLLSFLTIADCFLPPTLNGGFLLVRVVPARVSSCPASLSPPFSPSFARGGDRGAARANPGSRGCAWPLLGLRCSTRASDTVGDAGLGEVLLKAAGDDDESSWISVPTATAERLQRAGITQLTKVQAETHGAILEGRDVIVRSQTGTGKTMAFALPISQALPPQPCESPACLVLLPTRELAMQACGKKVPVVTAVGGSALDPLIDQLERGAPCVVVGTPGRVVECLRGGWLRLGGIRHLVVDECDQMLEGGFDDELDVIVDRALGARDPPQVVLTCATMPPQLRVLAEQLCTDPLIVDLVGRRRGAEGGGGSAGGGGVRHFATPAVAAARAGVLRDILAAHRPRSAIVFTSTKLEAVELSQTMARTWGGGGGVECLHGDLPQYQRSRVLEAFRKGHSRLLVATDVAARGIHVDDLGMVVHCGVPLTSSGASRRAKKDVLSVINVEQFMHRAGRTGRMGAGGASVVLYDPSAGEGGLLRALEKALGQPLELLEPPGREELVQQAAEGAERRIREVDPELLQMFEGAASELSASMGASQALAGALAALSGLEAPPGERSLLTGREGDRTVLFRPSDGDDGVSPSMVMGLVRERMPGMKKKVGRVTICQDGSAAFDLPAEQAAELVEGGGEGGGFEFAKSMPKAARRPPKETGKD